jgi:hypothetical protein
VGERVYRDRELWQSLGISRTTLWELRRRGLIESSRLYPGGPRVTTETQRQRYVDGLTDHKFEGLEKARAVRRIA